MSSTELARYQSLPELQTIAQTFALSAYFDAKGSSPAEIAKALTKILAGQEMNIGPYASMRGINIINGQTSFSGHLIASGIKASGKYDYRVREKSDKVCRIEFFQRTEKGWESVGIEEFTETDARKAGTKNMERFPKAMLFNRCISAGYRSYCPDALGTGAPVYTPEELGAEVTETGEYIEGTARVIEPATQPAAPAAAEWTTWRNADDALAWGALQLGDDVTLETVRQQYADLKASVKPKKAAEMFEAWYTSILEDSARSEAADAAQGALLDTGNPYN
jgi:hypothetical protein